MSLPIRCVAEGHKRSKRAPSDQVTGRGEIVEQGVEPDIAHIVRIKGQGDAPAQARDRPRDAQVAQGMAQEAQHLVAAYLGSDEGGVIVDVLD